LIYFWLNKIAAFCLNLPINPNSTFNQLLDMWHCDKHRQTQFSRQFFETNQASVSNGQSDFSGLVRDVEITVLKYASFNRHSLSPV